MTQGYGLDRRGSRTASRTPGRVYRRGTPGRVAAPDDQIIPDEIAARVTPEGIRAIAEKTKRAGVWNGLTLAIFQVFASGKSPAELAAAPR